jgi:hypothetical protein
VSASNNPNPPGDIDARLQFLLKSSECHDQQIGKLVERFDKLAETSERHERDNARFNRMMRAALEAYSAGDEGEPQ